jgi:hypothetical protein
MDGLLLILTVVAWAGITLAAKDIYRIKRHGYIKNQHLGVKR